MNSVEYDIIDELYFVTSFSDISRNLDCTEAELFASLVSLLKQGYIKCFFPDPDTEVEYNETDFQDNYRKYFFLATKAGLIAHNSR